MNYVKVIEIGIETMDSDTSQCGELQDPCTWYYSTLHGVPMCHLFRCAIKGNSRCQKCLETFEDDTE